MMGKPGSEAWAPRHVNVCLTLVLIVLEMSTSYASASSSSCDAKARVVSDLCAALGEQTAACSSSRSQLATECKRNTPILPGAHIKSKRLLGDLSADAGHAEKVCPKVWDRNDPNCNTLKVLQNHRFSSSCEEANAKNAKCKNACKRDRACKSKCDKSAPQQISGKYEIIRPLKNLGHMAHWTQKILGVIHFGICPMDKNAVLHGELGKCCLGNSFEGRIGKLKKDNCAYRCMHVKQCKAWQDGKQEETLPEGLSNFLLGEDATWGSRRRRGGGGSRRRWNPIKKMVKTAKVAGKKAKLAAKKVASAVKKAVKKIKKAARGKLSGIMGSMLKKLLSKLPKELKPILETAVTTMDVTKTLTKALPIAMKVLPKDVRPIVKVALTKFLATKSIPKTIKAVMNNVCFKEAFNGLLQKWIFRPILLKLKVNPCSAECLCRGVLNPFFHQKTTTEAKLQEKWKDAKRSIDVQAHDMFKKFNQPPGFDYFGPNNARSFVFTRIALFDIPELTLRGQSKCVKKGDVLCRARFDIFDAICQTCCCKFGKIFTNVGSKLSFSGTDICAGWFAVLDQVIRAGTNLFATVQGIDATIRCENDRYRRKHGKKDKKCHRTSSTKC